jgi:O-acetyl-ADP-ribose deacetylase (regulator of RNase III)
MIAWEGFGNLIEDKRSVQLCTVNAMGAMGKGLALTMRRAYPTLFKQYRDVYHPDFAAVKDLYARASILTMADVGETSVLLFCTKLHWFDPSPKDLVEGNLRRLAEQWEDLEIHQLAMPLVGTGQGKLPRPVVREMIHDILGPLPLPVRLYTGA